MLFSSLPSPQLSTPVKSNEMNYSDAFMTTIADLNIVTYRRKSGIERCNDDCHIGIDVVYRN